MIALFDLEPEPWVPVFNKHSPLRQNPDSKFNMTRKELEAWHREHDRCRDCGLLLASLSWSRCAGGAGDGAGPFSVCDACTELDECRPREGDPMAHVSHWGRGHAVSEHDRLESEREQRRRRYRAGL